MPKQPVRVHVFHQTYSLLADGDPKEVLELANEVDELMAAIAARASSGDSTRVAVLACFHLADQLRAANKRLQLFEDRSEKIATLLDDAIAEQDI